MTVWSMKALFYSLDPKSRGLSSLGSILAALATTKTWPISRVAGASPSKSVENTAETGGHRGRSCVGDGGCGTPTLLDAIVDAKRTGLTDDWCCCGKGCENIAQQIRCLLASLVRKVQQPSVEVEGYHFSHPVKRV